jgi:hypothetical protein
MSKRDLNFHQGTVRFTWDDKTYREFHEELKRFNREHPGANRSMASIVRGLIRNWIAERRSR